MIEVLAQGSFHAIIRRKSVTDALGVGGMMAGDAYAWLRICEYLHASGLEIMVVPNQPNPEKDVLVCRKIEPGRWL